MFLSADDFTSVDFTDYELTNVQKDEYINFFRLLDEFKKESNFEAYYLKMREYYSLISDCFSLEKQIKDYFDKADGFFCDPIEEINILLCPTSLYSIDLFSIPDQSKLYVLASVTDDINGYLQFGSTELYRDVLTEKIPYILTKRVYFKKNMEKYLETSIKDKKIAKQVCKAISISIYGETFTTKKINEYLEDCSDSGQKYVESIYYCIEEEYESNRHIYEKYEDFCPVFFSRITEILNGDQ